MHRLIFPENLKHTTTAFFTGKDPGGDIETITSLMKIKKDDVYMPIQKHTDKILLVESSREPKIADALVTQEKGILIGVQVADCVPILVHDMENGIVGAVHAGWRGTAQGILKKTMTFLTDRFFCRPENIMIALGPSIRWCCYEVDRDVYNAVKKASGDGEYTLSKGEKYCVDLSSANKVQALSMGVPMANIWMSDDCTFCSPEKFYSYRYAKGTTGRQAAFIGMF